MSTAASVTTSSVGVLIVELGATRCGLRLDEVAEVLPACTIVPLPDVPVWVDGVIDVRGELVPVVDGRARFGGAPSAVEVSDRFVLLLSGGRRRALRVDAAVDIIEITVDEMRVAIEAAEATPSAAGIARLPDGLLVIHDADTFLSTEDARAVDAALALVQAASSA